MGFSRKVIAKAQSRLWIHWKVPINGYEDMVYYSFETKKTLSSNNIMPGVKGLIKLIEGHLMGKYEVAIIYEVASNRVLRKYLDGKIIIDNI